MYFLGQSLSMSIGASGATQAPLECCVLLYHSSCQGSDCHQGARWEPALKSSASRGPTDTNCLKPVCTTTASQWRSQATVLAPTRDPTLIEKNNNLLSLNLFQFLSRYKFKYGMRNNSFFLVFWSCCIGIQPP